MTSHRYDIEYKQAEYIQKQHFRKDCVHKWYFTCAVYRLVGCRVKAKCPVVGPRPVRGVPSVGVFLRDPSPYLREFRKTPGKLGTAGSTRAADG